MAEPTPADRSRPQPVPPVPFPDRERPGSPLPVALTSFVGREREVAEVCALLRGGVRLLTLTGPGGVGKTRLALRVAEELAEVIADESAFVDLAPIGDPALVLPAVAQVLGIREAGGRPLAEVLTGVLRSRHVLLVIDNFEQVVEAAPQVARLLVACPSLAVLVTSRAPLRVSGEHLYSVSPLSVPDPADPPERVAEAEGVRLFIARARAAHHAFALSDANAPAVAAICRQLDGLPLAIELVAAKVRLLPPLVLLPRLEQALPILTGGRRDHPARLRTMRDAIAWSYDLLSQEEQVLFRRLAVFVGGCTLAAAEAVAVAPEEPVSDILAGLGSLVDQSLVQLAEQSEGEDPRYRMLETVREFGLERLAASGEEAGTRAAHAAWCLARAEPAYREAFSSGSARWFNAELDNLRAALDWFAATGESAEGQRLATALSWFWYQHGLVREARRWLERFLVEGIDLPPSVRSAAVTAAGHMAFRFGEYELAEAYATEALPLARQHDDPLVLYWTLGLLGAVAAEHHRDYARTAAHYEEMLAVGRAAGIAWAIPATLNDLGILAYAQGDLTLARQRHEEAATLHRAAGGGLNLSNNLACLAVVALRQGDCAGAARLLREVLTLEQELGLPPVNDGVALHAAQCSQAERAARLYGAIEARAEANGVEPYGVEAYRLAHERAIGSIRAALGDPAFAAAWAAGRNLSNAEFVAEAQVAVAAEPPPTEAARRSPDPAARSGLTPRELEVLRLVAAGRSDREIADALFIGPGTVRTHLTSLFGKLGIGSRTAAVAAARHRGIL